MKDSLPYKKLGDILQFSRGFDITKAQQKDGIYPVVSSSGITSYNDKFKCKGPGVVTGRKGTLGKVFYLEGNFWPHDTTLWVKDFKGNDPKYLYYLLTQLHLEAYDVGASNPTLNRNHIHKLYVQFQKDKTVQKLISRLLSLYDDLVEVNNKRIRILDKTAFQLYKEWFVRMRFAGYKNAHFEKGIPEGWQHKPIGEVIDYNIGGGWGNDKQTNEFSVSGYVIRGTDIPGIKRGEINKDVYRFHKASNLKSRELKEGDIIFETGCGSEGQLLGRTCFITQETLDAYGDKVMAASFCKQIRTTSIPSLYLYYFLNYLYETGMIETFQVQSTGISNYQFEPFLKFQEILLPKDELMQAFHDKVMPIHKQIATLGQQNSHLRQVRDRLLPRLISGKLQVKATTNNQQPNGQTELLQPVSI